MDYICNICNKIIKEYLNDEFYALDIYCFNSPKRKARIKRIKTYYICKSCYFKYIHDKNILIEKEPK